MEDCIQKCLAAIAQVNDSVVITGLHVPDREGEWSVIVSYGCNVPSEIMHGGRNRACYCGEWNETELFCKSKKTQDTLYIHVAHVLVVVDRGCGVVYVITIADDVDKCIFPPKIQPMRILWRINLLLLQHHHQLLLALL